MAKEIIKSDTHKQLASGVVLTGGGAKMPDLADFFKSYVKLPVSIGSSHKYTGVSEKIADPGYSTAIGLMLDDMDVPKTHKSHRFEANFGKFGTKLKELFKSLMP